jgi:hypothetical protein
MLEDKYQYLSGTYSLSIPAWTLKKVIICNFYCCTAHSEMFIVAPRILKFLLLHRAFWNFYCCTVHSEIFIVAPRILKFLLLHRAFWNFYCCTAHSKIFIVAPCILKLLLLQIAHSEIFIAVPCILNSKASHSPTDALFITLGKV